jgi:hypothetical protein
MDSFTDYYTLLGVDKDASSGEIKAAFKKLALQYHPDVYKGDDAQERMRLLLAAYQTLNDPEERKRYDARYTEFVDNSSSQVRSSRRTTFSTSRSSGDATRRAGRGAASSARRDRQRHYDFPDIRDGQPVHIDMGNLSYALSSGEAQTLLHQGMLRGVAPETPTHSYYCHRCSHSWRSPQGQSGGRKLPHNCPNCHATDWAEYLLLRCVHCCAVFESEQIRYEIGSYAYGNAGHRGGKSDLCPPYELFPLCPYCGSARWCPAEETRVRELRQRAEQSARRARVLWISVAVVALLVISIMAWDVLLR